MTAPLPSDHSERAVKYCTISQSTRAWLPRCWVEYIIASGCGRFDEKSNTLYVSPRPVAPDEERS